MKDYSNLLGEKPFSCNVEGCLMKSTNDDQLTIHKKKHDMVLNLGLGQKSYTDQTPTPTQFIRNCEEVGLFQDLQNVNPFEETFKRAVEAVKSGQLSLEKSLQSTLPDDTLHTPNVFPHITDVPSVNNADICDKSENIQTCDNDLLRQDISENDKTITAENVTQCHLSEAKKDCEVPLNCVNSLESKTLEENKVVLNLPDGHLVQLITPPEDSQASCNMVVIKNTVENLFSPLPSTVKEKLKKSLSEKKIKNLQHKVPILKCPVKRASNSLNSKFSKFSKNAMKLISKLETSGESEVNGIASIKQKKITKLQSKESRSEFLARSRAASFRCREKKKMYLLYLEKVNSELSTANQNLLLINSLLRQEISELHQELVKHKNCNAADKSTEELLSTVGNFLSKKPQSSEKEKICTEAQCRPQVSSEVIESSTSSKEELLPSDGDLILEDDPTGHETDPNLFSFDVAEVILNDEPEEINIPLNEGSKAPDIIVRFNSVGNDFPNRLPSDSHLDWYIEKAGDKAKQIYGEHSYYLKKSTVNTDKRIMNFKTFGETIEPSMSSDECKKLNTLHIEIKQNNNFKDLNSIDSKVLLGPRTPPPLILLKPFKKRSIQNKRNEKT